MFCLAGKEAAVSVAPKKRQSVMNVAMRWYTQLMVTMGMFMLATAPANCDKTFDSVTITENLEMGTLFGKMVGIILTIAFYAGALITVSGVFSLVMAYKDDNADGQTRAVRLIVVGCVLIGLQAILKAVGIIS